MDEEGEGRYKLENESYTVNFFNFHFYPFPFLGGVSKNWKNETMSFFVHLFCSTLTYCTIELQYHNAIVCFF